MPTAFSRMAGLAQAQALLSGETLPLMDITAPWGHMRLPTKRALVTSARTGEPWHRGHPQVSEEMSTFRTLGAGTPPGPGSCPGDDFSVSGNPHYGALVQSSVLPIPTVNIPVNSSTTDVSSGSPPPGFYRNLTLGSHGSITLTAPGTYNFDCISVGSFGTISTSPATGKITINVSGTGCASCAD